MSAQADMEGQLCPRELSRQELIPLVLELGSGYRPWSHSALPLSSWEPWTSYPLLSHLSV